MYTSPVSLILGFHGCDRAIGEGILEGKLGHLHHSENRYDWLGHGIYFWENNPERALHFAKELQARPGRDKPAIREPFVIGAVIDPGECLNLTESLSLRVVSQAYDDLRAISDNANVPLPTNKANPTSGEYLQRDLDCAVLETVHKLKKGTPYDSVRSVFTEGKALYPTAGFREKNHIQICVRNVDCIKGYFRLLPEHWKTHP